MGLFALTLEGTWREHLKTLEANIKLLEQYPDAEYLFTFMQACLDEANKAYHKEKENT
jgi:hypothetical protein